ncbi:hypothetical protein ACTL6P_04355 [Endozoicomonas acroporae]|uniref:hypothetical protein n=1 Tax=Endozoicomonas acroporae TaxID=1701104 RepID=UPI000C78AC73|nr:hypothetical protein [Endozoicomonas acroporae]
MPKFPALPATVDRYVREFLNKLVGRSGKAGDRVDMISDLTDLGWQRGKPTGSVCLPVPWAA